MKMTSHLKSQFDSANCALLPNDVKDGVLADYQIMSHLGIDNDEDQNRFFMVLNHVPEIAHLIFNVDLNDKTARFIAAEVFKNREKAPISSLLELIEAVALALKKMAPDSIKPKTAYPQPPPRQQLPTYDIARWVNATRKIYSLMSKGYSKEQAKAHVLDGWQQREIMDYEQWLRFYTEKGPEKYPKLASEVEEMRLGGVPVNMLKAVAPFQSGRDYMPKVPPGLPQDLPHDTSDVRDKIETQRKKIISRLNSAERLLSGPDGHIFAGRDLELMLKLLQDLKRRVQTANKLTVNSTLFEDFIFRAANQLKFQGRNEAAGFFYKIAQLPPLGGPPGGGLGSPVGGPGGSDAGAEGEQPPTGKGNKQETHDLLEEFFDNLKRGVNDKDDTPEEREELKKQPEPETTTPAPAAAETPPPEGEEVESAEAAIEVDDLIKIGNGYWHPFISVGQVAPTPPPAREGPRPAPTPNQAPPSPEVVGDEGAPSGTPDDNTDDVIEAALKNVSINDVINRLEMLVSIYNQREISRQLSILDIMMDRIGLSSYFPQLGEAMGKALESNQYIGNRLSEILTKVRGSVEAPGAAEWIDVSPEKPPETEGIRQRLEQKDQQEERRKEMRKEKEIAKMEGRPEAQAPAAAPVADAADLQRPSRVEKAPRLDVR